MTALSVPPPLSPRDGGFLLYPRASDDRGVLRAALAAAVLLHVAALLFPWQRKPDEPTPPPAAGPTIVLGELVPPPPPLEPPPRPAPAPRERLLPVPFDTEPLPGPVAEPERRQAPQTPADLDTLVGAVPVPPPPPAIVDERTPGLVLPQSLERPAPEYPRLAVTVRKQGRVILSAVIDVDGRVTGIEVLAAPRPDLGLADAAVDAVSRWTYRPGRLNGRPVAVRMTVRVDFSLE